VEGWSGLGGGIGNTGADPLFVDAHGPDGIVGTLDDNLRLSPNSPLINAGDPGFVVESGATDIAGNPRLQGCWVDMGAYEANVPQLLGDFHADGNLDLADVAGFQLRIDPSISNPTWLKPCLCTFDYDEDNQIDLLDFKAFHSAFVNP